MHLTKLDCFYLGIIAGVILAAVVCAMCFKL